MSLTRRWKLQMEATEMFPKVPAYPPNVERARGSFSKRQCWLLRGKLGTARGEEGDRGAPVVMEEVVNFGTI